MPTTADPFSGRGRAGDADARQPAEFLTSGPRSGSLATLTQPGQHGVRRYNRSDTYVS